MLTLPSTARSIGAALDQDSSVSLERLANCSSRFHKIMPVIAVFYPAVTVNSSYPLTINTTKFHQYPLSAVIRLVSTISRS